MKVEKLDDKTYRVESDTIYPDDLEYGVMFGLVRRVVPAGTGFVVSYDETVQRKDLGGPVTVMIVSLRT